MAVKTIDLVKVIPVDADGEGKGMEVYATVAELAAEGAAAVPEAGPATEGTVMQAAFVANADPASLATLAADIDELRDSLIAAGIMAAS